MAFTVSVSHKAVLYFLCKLNADIAVSIKI